MHTDYEGLESTRRSNTEAAATKNVRLMVATTAVVLVLVYITWYLIYMAASKNQQITPSIMIMENALSAIQQQKRQPPQSPNTNIKGNKGAEGGESALSPASNTSEK